MIGSIIDLQNSMKKLALFDIDGVIYQGHTIFDTIQDQEIKNIVPKGTWNKILFELAEYKSGHKNYKQAADSMLNTYASALKGVNYQKVVNHNLTYLKINKSKFFPYFGKLIPQLEDKYDIYFVTANFQFTCDSLFGMFGVRNYLSSIAEVKNGKFTGKVTRSLSGNKGIVSDLIEKYGNKGSFAVGDSENDADMLDKVQFPLVMEPNEKLEKIAKEKGWKVVNRNTIADIIMTYVR